MTYYIRLILLLIITIFCLTLIASAEAIIADHNDVPLFEQIPSSVINQVQDNYRLFYGHTSHGSQIVTGMGMLRDENILYDFNNGEGTLIIQEYGSDLGDGSGTPPSWFTVTCNHLDQPDCPTNVVMWSWCGGASYASEVNINNYLYYMTQLETDYPGVTFIYMTGHLDGTGPTGILYRNNNLIRDYCALNDKVLFDFADIESYDPDGNYYPDESDFCNWCYSWCESNPCDMCPEYCAHSHCLNCYLKGKAFWWMMATIAGWQPETDICGDANSDSVIDIFDVIFIINYKYKDGPTPASLNQIDVDNSGAIDIFDVVYLINYKYKDGPDLICP